MSQITKDMSIAQLLESLGKGNSVRFDSRCLERTARFLQAGGGHLTCEVFMGPLGVVMSPLRNKDQKDKDIRRLAGEVDDLMSKLSQSLALGRQLKERAEAAEAELIEAEAAVLELMGDESVAEELDEVEMASDDIHGDVIESDCGRDPLPHEMSDGPNMEVGALNAYTEDTAEEVETVETTFGMGVESLDGVLPEPAGASVMSADEQDEIGMAGEMEDDTCDTCGHDPDDE